jgi:hypothetical protein
MAVLHFLGPQLNGGSEPRHDILGDQFRGSG